MLGLNRKEWWRTLRTGGVIAFILCALIVFIDGVSIVTGMEDNLLPQIMAFTALAIAPIGLIVAGIMFILSKPRIHTVAVMVVTLSGGIGASLGTLIISLY